jgi:hypothetical protein
LWMLDFVVFLLLPSLYTYYFHSPWKMLWIHHLSFMPHLLLCSPISSLGLFYHSCFLKFCCY